MRRQGSKNLIYEPSPLFSMIFIFVPAVKTDEVNLRKPLPISSASNVYACSSFTTALGKPIRVDEKSLLLGKKILHDLSSNTPLDEYGGKLTDLICKNIYLFILTKCFYFQ